MKKALILSDGKPGHFNQSKALCQHLGIDFDIVETSYPTGAAKALSYLLDRGGIYTPSLFKISRPDLFTSSLGQTPYALIISAGSTTYYPNKCVARHLQLPNIAILMPQSYRLDFSHILCPGYDNPPAQQNITPLPLNLCAADPAFFEEKRTQFLEKHSITDQPAVGIIVGGPSKTSRIVATEFEQQLDQLFQQTEGAQRWITTSRRTPPAIEAIIKKRRFDYCLIASEVNYNPIPAFITLCDRLFVTSDSASMISECASFGDAYLEILMNHQTRSPNKFEQFIQGLEQQQALHIFDGTLGQANRKIKLEPLIKQALSPWL
jgi:uncharacterized protein